MAQLSFPIAPSSPPMRVRVVYEVEARDHLFLLDEDDMPESPLHHEVILLLDLILRSWAARSGREVLVAHNLACRLDPHDARLGVDPDLCLLEPPPADLDTLGQLRLWEGHPGPWLGIEIVSGSTAPKDYHDAPVKYARLGTQELWVFDPRREGPSDTGGPFALQVWRQQGDRMERIYAGAGPTFSPAMSAWLVVTDGGRRLRLANDAQGHDLWPTPIEQADDERCRADDERRRADDERRRADDERAARARAEEELAELRRRLAALESKTQG